MKTQIVMHHRAAVLLAAVLVMAGGGLPAAWGQDFSVAGAYAAGWQEVTISRPNNTTFNALLYYPAQAEGQNAPFAAAASPCPGISFGHGFLTNPNKYRSTFAHLASWGYCVVASRSGGELFPSHQNFANDLSHCLTWLIETNDNPASFLHGRIDTEALGLSGHSMGGGCSILAAAADGRVRAVANLAAAETNPSAIDAIPSLDVAVALISGSDDSIVPLGSHGQQMYDNGHGPKLLPVINGGYHCGFLDSAIIFCDSGSISRAEQLAATRQLLTAFFELYLKQNQDAWQAVWGPAILSDVRLTAQSDPGFALTPAQTDLRDYAGVSARADMALAHNADDIDQYDLLVEGNQWPTSTSISESALLSVGESVPFDVQVTLPDAFAVGQTDSVLVSARSRADMATRAFAQIHSTTRLPGDVNDDLCVDSLDLQGLLAYWLNSPCSHPLWCEARDFNHDGQVDVTDFTSIAMSWAQCF